MDKDTLELYLYMGSTEPIYDWLKSEGVTTKQGALDAMRSAARGLCGEVYSSIGRGEEPCLAGAINVVKRILSRFAD
jgi:hypothetical protein